MEKPKKDVKTRKDELAIRNNKPIAKIKTEDDKKVIFYFLFKV